MGGAANIWGGTQVKTIKLITVCKVSGGKGRVKQAVLKTSK